MDNKSEIQLCLLKRIQVATEVILSSKDEKGKTPLMFLYIKVVKSMRKPLATHTAVICLPVVWQTKEAVRLLVCWSLEEKL